jgi:hypothetical protein
VIHITIAIGLQNKLDVYLRCIVVQLNIIYNSNAVNFGQTGMRTDAVQGSLKKAFIIITIVDSEVVYKNEQLETIYLQCEDAFQSLLSAVA